VFLDFFLFSNCSDAINLHKFESLMNNRVRISPLAICTHLKQLDIRQFCILNSQTLSLIVKIPGKIKFGQVFKEIIDKFPIKNSLK